MLRKKLFLLTVLGILASQADLMGQAAPELADWIQNTTGITGRHYMAGNTTPINDTAHANVQLVRYSAANVYVNCSGIPAYVIGPFLDGNPAQGTNRNYLFRIPRNPQENTGTLTVPGLGQIGVWKNGVPIYNYADAMSYNNQGIWHQNAVVFENDGFDCCHGHPSPVFNGPPGQGALVGGNYHHHQNPSTFDQATLVISNVCDMYPSDGLYVLDSTQHSPLLGYSFDGFPVYGAYAYQNTNGTGNIVRMRPSFRLRNITDRTTLPDGTVLQPSQYGPSISSTPLGSYKEDFEFVPGSGDLDIHNGRVCVTPEYPAGIYCYFATVDENQNSAYPYVIGESYYGVVATDNFPTPGGQNPTSVVVNEPVTVYNPATGIYDATSPLKFSIYPNPAKDLVGLQISEAIGEVMTVELMDLQGRILRSTSILPGLTKARIDLNGIAAGTYLVKVAGNGTSTTMRLSVL